MASMVSTQFFLGFAYLVIVPLLLCDLPSSSQSLNYPLICLKCLRILVNEKHSKLITEFWVFLLLQGMSHTHTIQFIVWSYLFTLKILRPSKQNKVISGGTDQGILHLSNLWIQKNTIIYRIVNNAFGNHIWML